MEKIDLKLAALEYAFKVTSCSNADKLDAKLLLEEAQAIFDWLENE